MHARLGPLVSASSQSSGISLSEQSSTQDVSTVVVSDEPDEPDEPEPKKEKSQERSSVAPAAVATAIMSASEQS